MFDRILFASIASYEKRPDLVVTPMLFDTEEQCVAHIARMDAETELPGPVREMFGKINRRCVRVRVTELDEDVNAYDPLT